MESGSSQIESEHLLSSYDFELPKELIAQEPLPNRSDARLMVVNRAGKSISHTHIRDITRELLPGDCLVLNDTRVVPAQLVGQRESTGGRWQGLVVQSDGSQWKMLAKTRGKISVGELVDLHDRQGKPRCKLALTAKLDNGFWTGRPLCAIGETEDSELAGRPLAEIIHVVGRVPLPHYIRGGNMVDSDLKNYQTVFAKNEGAIAAPTAGLHFTKPLLEKLIDRGIRIAPLTLHVGIGTFRPVSTENLNEHQMHREYCSISQSTVDIINSCRNESGRVVAVGTTSMRVLETAAKSGDLLPWEGETDLFIKPGFQFNVVDALLTNFHLPKSTLLVLVRTFGGDSLIKQAYEEAIEEQYRFFSYGDAMLIS